MAIEDTSLMQEVLTILQQEQKSFRWHWRAEIIANDEIVNPIKLLSLDNVGDYANAYADELFVELVIGAGTYAHKVYPYKNDLKIKLYREPLVSSTEEQDDTREIETQTLRAILIDDQSSVIEGNAVNMQSQLAGDLTDVRQVKFQLVDLALEQVRMQSVGGVFRDTTASEVLRYVLTTVSAQVDVEDEEKITGVDLYQPSNTTPQKQIVITHGTPFADIPDFLHQSCGGIYNAGLGYYLKNKTWYVYPLYDTKRYESSLKSLTLINVPKNRFPGVELTYRLSPNADDPNQIIALVTGEVKHADDTEKLQLNQGNGVRFADARMMLPAFSETKNNRTMVLRATNNNEYLASERQNGLNNVRLSGDRITSNVFVELSKMARRAGSHLQCVWENSDPSFLFPGMPVRYLYLVNDVVMEAYGILIGVHTLTNTSEPGLTARRYSTQTALTLFLDRGIDWTEAEETEEDA